MTTNELISKAEKDITNILAKLETDTGMVLDKIDVRDVEMSAMNSNHSEYYKRLSIEMKRIPGTKWL